MGQLPLKQEANFGHLVCRGNFELFGIVMVVLSTSECASF